MLAIDAWRLFPRVFIPGRVVGDRAVFAVHAGAELLYHGIYALAHALVGR